MSRIYFASIVILLMPILNAQSQGFVVTSVSLSNILHPGQSASQVQWIVTASLNGGGQSLVGTLTNSSINYQGFTSQYPLQISASTNPGQAFYLINNQQPSAIYSYTYLTEYGAINQGLIVTVHAAPSCPSSYGAGTYYSEWDTVLSPESLGALSGFLNNSQATAIRTCIYQQASGYESGISQVNQLFSSLFTVSANGQTEPLTISSNNQSATSPDGKVQINWVGSLITGTGIPEASQFVAISNNQQSPNWVAGTASSYSTYQSQHSTTSGQLSPITFNPSTTGNNYPSPCSQILINVNNSYLTNIGNCLVNSSLKGIIAQNNDDAESLLQGINIGGYGTQTSSYQGQSAFLVTIPSEFTTTNPLITMRISGAFVGVIIPLGTPKILSVTSQPFNSGNSGNISVEVKNVGNTDGSFYTSLSNCDGIKASTSPNYAFQADQIENLSMAIYTSGANENITEQCTVTVTDANGGGSDSSQVNVVMKQANQCTPNKQIIQGSSICSCTNVNGVYEPTSCNACPYGVTSVNDQFVCASAPSGTNSSSSSLNISINAGQVAGSVVPVLQTVVSASNYISCTPFVGSIINMVVPAVTTVANFISKLSGNSCG